MQWHCYCFKRWLQFAIHQNNHTEYNPKIISFNDSQSDKRRKAITKFANVNSINQHSWGMLLVVLLYLVLSFRHKSIFSSTSFRLTNHRCHAFTHELTARRKMSCENIHWTTVSIFILGVNWKKSKTVLFNHMMRWILSRPPPPSQPSNWYSAKEFLILTSTSRLFRGSPSSHICTTLTQFSLNSRIFLSSSKVPYNSQGTSQRSSTDHDELKNGMRRKNKLKWTKKIVFISIYLVKRKKKEKTKEVILLFSFQKV